jgi:predicted branched-subunit amino acid permease
MAQPMKPINKRSFYQQGYFEGLPFIVVAAPFGLLFGVVGTEAGLNIIQVMSMTILVIAGAAQFTAIAMMQDNAPTLVVLASALAVNLRMAMYSASIAPHLGKLPLPKKLIVSYFLVDQSYAIGFQKMEQNPDMVLSQKFSFFMGIVSAITPFWFASTFIGALLGQAIPSEFALDFAVPITFIAIAGPALRTIPHIVAAAVSVIFALLFVALPFNLGLLVAAILALMAGAQTEVWMSRRGAS